VTSYVFAEMEYKRIVPGRHRKVQPRLIIHGGAGNITPDNLPPDLYRQYRSALLTIVASTYKYLLAGNDALDTVTYAVAQLEDNPLFNSGHGAVFTRDGVNEMEASVMVSSGKKKRGVGVMGLRHVKNPIKLAREMLIRGEDDLEGGNGEHRGPMASQTASDKPKVPSRGAQGHSQLFGAEVERLAKQWDIELAGESYFFVQKRWDEHIKGLEREREGHGSATWDAQEYVPQGTCGAVCLDADGVCAVATSTGGMTNKLTGRIGDTPTLGAGFWAEEWTDDPTPAESHMTTQDSLQISTYKALMAPVASCLPGLTTYEAILDSDRDSGPPTKAIRVTRATAMSGTGNGDSFLRMNAVRTASAIARYRPNTTLRTAVAEVTGPGGELEKSAGNRWQQTGEGEGGIIGIESTIVTSEAGEQRSVESEIVEDYNCGGMFRASITKDGKAVARIWRPGQYGGLKKYDGEGVAEDIRRWLPEKS
jgi:L-asparaginase